MKEKIKINLTYNDFIFVFHYAGTNSYGISKHSQVPSTSYKSSIISYNSDTLKLC